MNADQYLFTILQRETVGTSMPQAVLNALRPIIVPWANQYLAGIAPSGSFAKGTAIKSGTDIDLFISLKPETRETLKEIYHSLHRRMQEAGLSPNMQNVSINVRVGSYSPTPTTPSRFDFALSRSCCWTSNMQSQSRTRRFGRISHSHATSWSGP